MNLTSSLKTLINRGRDICKVRKPELLLAGGLVGIGIGVGFTVWGTFRTKDILDEELERECEIWDDVDEKDDESVGLASRDCFNERIRAAVKIGTSYIPAVAGLGVGITCIIASRNEYARRFALLAAGYNTLLATFNEYRAKVIEDHGAEYDKSTLVKAYESRKYLDGHRDANGQSWSEDEALKVLGLNPNEDCMVIQFNEYTSPLFDRRYGGENWSKVKLVYDCARNIFHSQHYLFLSDVLKMLDIDPTQFPMSFFVGWVDDPQMQGADIIDFGLDDEANWESLENTDEALPITLIFNHQGVITPYLECVRGL